MRIENDLGKDSIGRLVWRIAIPSMLAQFVSVLYNIIDRMFVGNIAGVGDLALAGVGVCGPVVNLVGSFAFLIGIGGSSLMGIRMGEGNLKKARQILANAFLCLCVMSVILTIIALPLCEPMLRLFGASDVTYPYAGVYFKVYVGGTVFALLSTGMNQFIICQGYARTGMISVMIGAVMNIILDPVFIFLLDMGVAGAALATVLSQACSCGYILHFLFSQKSRVRITFGNYSWRVIGRMVQLGFTPFIIIAIDNVMVISMNAVLQRYGEAQGDALITCNTIVQSFMLLVTMPYGGITGGTQSILSFNFGACQSDRVLKAQRYITGLCMLYGVIMFVLARTAGSAFASLFTSDPELNAQACRAIRICTLAIIPLAIQYEIVDGFTAMGQVQASLPLSFWRKAVYFAAVFLLPVLFGADAVFYAEPLSDILGPIVSVTVYLLTINKILHTRETSVQSQ